MPLWFALLLASVTTLAILLTGIVAYIVLSLNRAAPIMLSRIGRQPLTASVFGREYGPVRVVVAIRSRRHPQRQHWAHANA